jgi:RHS repeat-associated protein
VAQFGYDDLGHLALVLRDGASYRVVTDPVGSPRLVIDSQTGAVVDAIAYDAWGSITHDTAPGFIPFGFGGGLLDPDTGLVHLGARDYDTTAGRWTGPDPLQFAGGDPNLYRYAGGDPVNLADPTGLFVPGFLWLIAPVVAGVGVGMVYNTGEARGAAQSGANKPSTPPQTPAPQDGGSGPPAPQSGGPYYYSCRGFMCRAPNGSSGCVLGNCSNGPTGFSCMGVYCKGPHGGECYFCSVGDTHLRTGDATHVDFQAAGEFLALASPDGKLAIQARQEPVLGGTAITFNTAVAANVDGDRVGVYAKEPSFLVVNGLAVNAPDLAEQLPHGGTLERHGGMVSIGWTDGSRLTITRVVDTLDYGFGPGSGVGATLRGLLGSADGSPANDLTGRDGRVLDRSDPAFATKLYQQFGNSWRISQAESLFQYQPGESTATFTRLDIPSAAATVGSLSSSVRANAEAVCRAVGVQAEPALDDCILDVGMTGDPAFAASSAAVAAQGPSSSTTAGPPTAPGTRGPLVLGHAMTGKIASAGQRDDYTFAVSAGQIVYLQALGPCVTGLDWALLRPDGSVDTYNATCHDIARQVLGSAGTWTVRVSASGAGASGATGAYSFTVWAVPATTTSSMSLGQAVSGSIDSIGQWHDYTFSVSAGQIVNLKAHGACVAGLNWALLRPDGGVQTYNGSCNDIGRQVLADAGTWTIRVSSDGTATGAYAFTVAQAT